MISKTEAVLSNITYEFSQVDVLVIGGLKIKTRLTSDIKRLNVLAREFALFAST